ncbi:MAG: histidine phosphatase family protein [bacterium]|nr:histidine phosphatase family protein [bacterium]
MNLYVVRHGQINQNKKQKYKKLTISEYNAIVTERGDASLNPLGIQQSHELSFDFYGQKIDRIFSSPIKRALETAKILEEELKIEVTILPDAYEILPPILKSKNSNKKYTRKYLIIRSFFKSLIPFKKSSESFFHMFFRARKVWKKLTENPSDDIIFVSHQGFINVLFLYLKFERRCIVVDKDLSNCGVSEVRYTASK